MVDVVVTRADRAAAVVAVYGNQWRIEASLHSRVESWVEGEALTPATAHQVPARFVSIARGIAAARAAERERCAGMVVLLAAEDECATPSSLEMLAAKMREGE